MPKAILELEMPESCKTCPIKRYLHYGWVEYICGITGEEIANKGRRADCPLKLVEENKLISTIDNIEKVDGIDNYFLHRNYHSGELELNITFKNDIADSILKDSGIQEIESSAFWE